jgi:hypothetical protein
MRYNSEESDAYSALPENRTCTFLRSKECTLQQYAWESPESSCAIRECEEEYIIDVTLTRKWGAQRGLTIFSGTERNLLPNWSVQQRERIHKIGEAEGAVVTRLPFCPS